MAALYMEIDCPKLLLIAASECSVPTSVVSLRNTVQVGVTVRAFVMVSDELNVSSVIACGKLPLNTFFVDFLRTQATCKRSIVTD